MRYVSYLAILFVLFVLPTSLTYSHSRVVVVPLIGDGDGHTHPQQTTLTINIPPEEFRLKRLFTSGNFHIQIGNSGSPTAGTYLWNPDSLFNFAPLIAPIYLPIGGVPESLRCMYYDNSTGGLDLDLGLTVRQMTSLEPIVLLDENILTISNFPFIRTFNFNIDSAAPADADSTYQLQFEYQHFGTIPDTFQLRFYGCQLTVAL